MLVDWLRFWVEGADVSQIFSGSRVLGDGYIPYSPVECLSAVPRHPSRPDPLSQNKTIPC